MNFVGAARELKDLYTHLRSAQIEPENDKFCADQGVQWRFALEHAPHFVWLWEAAVKNLKHHFWSIIGDVCHSFEELQYRSDARYNAHAF